MNKRDQFYFDNLSECIGISERAAHALLADLKDYDKVMLEEQLLEMHHIENTGDHSKHKLTEAVIRDFITPLEREDLVSLSNLIDDITDCIEELLRSIYIADVDEIRADIIPIIEVLVNCIATLKELVNEFKDFKKSKKIKELIILVNDYEEHGDRYYMKSLRDLYLSKDIGTIVIWKDIYEYIENCFDTCEDVADIIQTVMMKNM